MRNTVRLVKMKTSVSYKSGNQYLFSFWTYCLLLKYVLPVPLVTAKLIIDYFDNKRYRANKTFLYITCQFICAPNHWSVKRDAARTRKKSASLKLFLGMCCVFDPHRQWLRRLRCVYILVLGWFYHNLICRQNYCIYSMAYSRTGKGSTPNNSHLIAYC